MLFFASTQAQEISVDLNSNWRFRKVGDKEWLSATVPGTVHTDLLNNKKILDPFFGDNEKKLQWIENSDWEYETWFDIADSAIQQNHCELSFEGLDTYAKVFLNDSLILSADNMFRTWNVDCKKFLKAKQNHLLIQFESAVRKGKELAKQLPYTLPGDEKVFTRKAQYQYGWDWGPRFVTCGIWRPMKLKMWSVFKINTTHLFADEISDSIARVIVEVNITVDRPTTVFFKLVAENGTRDSSYSSITVTPEEKISNLLIEIKNPKLWWCNGLGNPALYHITMQATNSNQQSELKEFNYGLRTVTLIQQVDTVGRNFYFILNGVHVFMKGANWIPADNFLPRITKEKYRTLLSDVKDANMNMLRVWGGGVYEDNSFYNLCDSLGILAWQDFMFACAMYPGDSSFIENVKEEIEENVIRLRDHACLALWCGNNEIDEGWKNWEWQKQYKYSENDSLKIWNDYYNLFYSVIPDVLSKTDPLHQYIESSPRVGWGHKESFERGDSHYWGVWWGMEPFEIYKKKIGRFVSEYGFQGMPAMKTIESFTNHEERNRKSLAIKNHEKHPTGFETIDHYMNDWYKKPKDFESYVYVSQLLQAEGVTTAIEAHRRAKPYCMGTLYWQLNDCWPATSWSSTDYYGRWKALHYAVKHSYEKYVISVGDREKILSVHVTSDDTSFTKATLTLCTEDFSGKVLWRDSTVAYVSEKQSTIVYKTMIDDLTSTLNPSRAFLKMELKKDEKILAQKIYFFKKPKDLLLDKPDIHFSVQKLKDEVTIFLSSSTLAKNIFLDLKETEVHFSENYFDLLPNETKTISFQSTLTFEEVKKKIVLKSLWDSF